MPAPRRTPAAPAAGDETESFAAIVHRLLADAGAGAGGWRIERTGVWTLALPEGAAWDIS